MPNTHRNFDVTSTANTFWRLYHLLTNGDPFVYSRFGDGELLQMLGSGDLQHNHNPLMAEEMKLLFQVDPLLRQSPAVLTALAMHDHEVGMEPGLFEGWTQPKLIELVNELAHSRHFENAIALHYYSVFKPVQLRKLFDLRRGSTKVFVGNADPDKLEPALGAITHYVHVPYENAYDTIDQWFPAIQNAVDDGAYLVYLATGTAAKAASYRMIREKMQVQSVDLGSVADYLAGEQPNRTWIRLARERFPGNEVIINGGV